MIELLLRKTEQGDVPWQKGLNSTEFSASFADFSVEVEQTEYKFEEYVNMRVYNEEGDVIESLSSFELYQSDEKTHAKMMEKLYQQARRKALKAEETLDHILKSLRQPID